MLIRSVTRPFYARALHLLLVLALLPMVHARPLSSQTMVRAAPPPPPGDELTLNQLMSAQDQAAAGLDSLDSAQRAALQDWIARYTALVATATRLADGQQDGIAQTQMSPRPAAAQWRGGASAAACYLPAGAPLTEIVGGGAVVTLGDGTRWQVALSDQVRADGWQTGEFIIIERIGAPTGDYDFALVNAATRWRAAARFAGYGPAAEVLPR